MKNNDTPKNNCNNCNNCNKLLFSPYGAFSSDWQKACFRWVEGALLKSGNKASNGRKQRLQSLPPVHPEFKRVDDVLPQHVAAGTYGCYGIEVHVGDPDGKGCVLLEHGLSGAYRLA